MNRSGSVIFGYILLAAGIFLLLNEYGVGLRVNFSWPVFLVFTGAVLLLAYFTSRPKPGYLRAGLILITLGFFFTLLEDIPALGLNYDIHWPGILIAVGIGLFLSGVIDRASRGMISSGLMITGIGITLLVFSIGGWDQFGPRGVSLMLGLVLVFTGLKIVMDFFMKKKVES